VVDEVDNEVVAELTAETKPAAAVEEEPP